MRKLNIKSQRKYNKRLCTQPNTNRHKMESLMQSITQRNYVDYLYYDDFIKDFDYALHDDHLINDLWLKCFHGSHLPTEQLLAFCSKFLLHNYSALLNDNVIESVSGFSSYSTNKEINDLAYTIMREYDHQQILTLHDNILRIATVCDGQRKKTRIAEINDCLDCIIKHGLGPSKEKYWPQIVSEHNKNYTHI